MLLYYLTALDEYLKPMGGCLAIMDDFGFQKAGKAWLKCMIKSKSADNAIQLIIRYSIWKYNEITMKRVTFSGKVCQYESKYFCELTFPVVTLQHWVSSREKD